MSRDPKKVFLVECHDRQRALHEPRDNFFMSYGDFFCGSRDKFFAAHI